MKPRVATRGDDRWQVDYDDGGTDVAQVVIDDATGEVVEAWRNQQVEVKLARGYEGAVAGNVSEAWIWIPLCLLFVLPFFDPRRPFRLLHLDLLVLLAFSVSQFFFNKGEIVWSVPLVYPVLAYLFAADDDRGLPAEDAPRAAGPVVVDPLARCSAAVALAVFRIVLNVVDSQVIDIGFANVVGADRIAGGDGVYDGQFTTLIDRGDSYGPLSYLSYIPFEQLFPWGGGLEELPAAHAAAIVFDLAVVGLLYLCRAPPPRGPRRPRPRDRARLRLARLPLHAVRARRQRRQRRARRGAARRGADRLRLAGQARARDRARRGRRSSVRSRWRRCSPPATASGGSARRSSSAPSSSRSGRSSCCRCSPTAASGSSTTGRSATRHRAGRRSASGGSSPRSAGCRTSPASSRFSSARPSSSSRAAGPRCRSPPSAPRS